jgi:predicted amidohydrolase YtcJ
MLDNAVAEKRTPGMPDRTLDKIVSDAGGTLTTYAEGRKVNLALALGNKVFTAENNTALITEVFRAMANRGTVCMDADVLRRDRANWPELAELSDSEYLARRLSLKTVANPIGQVVQLDAVEIPNG